MGKAKAKTPENKTANESKLSARKSRMEIRKELNRVENAKQAKANLETVRSQGIEGRDVTRVKIVLDRKGRPAVTKEGHVQIKTVTKPARPSKLIRSAERAKTDKKVEWLMAAEISGLQPKENFTTAQHNAEIERRRKLQKIYG